MFLNSIHYIKEDVFSSSFCNQLMKENDQKKLELAKIADGNSVNRKSYVTWLNDTSLNTKIFDIIQSINQKTKWNFSLTELEPLQYTVYSLRNFYDWHIDSHTKPYDNGLIRKLSFTICLNDNETENNNYTGGDFELCLPHPYHNKNKYFRFRKVFKQGTIIVFPSHIWHKVHPIISGTRKVLVGWVVGKSFV